MQCNGIQFSFDTDNSSILNYKKARTNERFQLICVYQVYVFFEVRQKRAVDWEKNIFHIIGVTFKFIHPFIHPKLCVVLWTSGDDFLYSFNDDDREKNSRRRVPHTLLGRNAATDP